MPEKKYCCLFGGFGVFFYLEKKPEGRCKTLTHSYHIKIVAHNGFAIGLAAPA